MFIDYLTLMLVNMAAGLFILSLFIAKGLATDDQRNWSIGFGISGFIALVTGLYTTFTWPLPGSFNMAFGELAVLFGAIFLAAAIVMTGRGSLILVAIFAFFGGLASIVVGIGIYKLGMTQMPDIAAAGFVLTGLGGVLAYPCLVLRRNVAVRALGTIAMLAAAAIWAFIGYAAYWNHLDSLRTYHPPTMQEQVK